ncbi:MAG: hypothetical protein ACJA1Z_002246, partial [Patiriisocius sp.]
GVSEFTLQNYQLVAGATNLIKQCLLK